MLLVDTYAGAISKAPKKRGGFVVNRPKPGRGPSAPIHLDWLRCLGRMAKQNGVKTEAIDNPELGSLGALAGGIAHDFNNLLTGVVGNADLARALLPSNSPAQEALQEITASAQRAAALCGQLLAYAGQGRFERRPLDVEALVRSTLPTIPGAASNEHELRVEAQSDLAAIDADEDQIRQVLVNLVTNALEAIGEGPGVVRIVLANAEDSQQSADPSRVRIAVIDDGEGMDEFTRAHMFEPFFSRRAAGRGLGLPATRGIVTRHGGEISVHTQVGHGTTVQLLLPAASHDAECEVPEVSANAPIEATGAVLVVDDEPLVQDVVARILVREGYTVVRAEDGEAALRLFRRHRSEIRLVLLDLVMPTMGGKVALRHLRRLAPELPVVLMSGYDEQRVMAEPDVGHVGFVQKPFRRDVLLDAVRSELCRASPRRSTASEPAGT